MSNGDAQELNNLLKESHLRVRNRNRFCALCDCRVVGRLGSY